MKAKKALLSSILIIFISIITIIGTSYAWFTDTATTSGNKIKAGNLDVALEMSTDGGKTWENAEGQTLNFTQKQADGMTKENADIKWEPGCTYELPQLRVINKGNLAIKYKVKITGINGDSLLNEVIEWTIDDTIINSVEEHLKANEESEPFIIKGHMQETAESDYQDLSIEGISITVYATQDTYENDSYDNQYDKDATYKMTASIEELNSTITLDTLKDDNGNVMSLEITVNDVMSQDIFYNESQGGYIGKGIILGNLELNKYAATPAEIGKYKFIFKDGNIYSSATGYNDINNYTDSSIYMLIPGNSDVTFENIVFNGIISFNIQKYTSPWSNLNSITFKNCTFNGLIVGTSPASNIKFDDCVFNNYTNTMTATNSNPIWWQEDIEGTGNNITPIKTFTFINNKVYGTRPIRIENLGKNISPVLTIKKNEFDISKQYNDTNTKNMGINIGMGNNPNMPFTLIDDGNIISKNTASLYTVAKAGTNQYKEISGMKILDGKSKDKTITALIWETTNNETFEMKTVK